MSFKDKVVLITGASSGIGAVTAELFAKEKASLSLVGRNDERLKKVADKCMKHGVDTLVLKAEMTNDQDVNDIVDQTIEKYGKLDVLVNSAGITTYASILDNKIMQDFDKVMNINLRSVVLLTTLATPHLAKTKGNIVNVSSVFGSSFLGTPGCLAYCVSKAALNHFTKGAALELSSVGVRVNSISPGATRTDILKNAGSELTWEGIASNLKLDRVCEPEEIADLIVFVASEKARSITGVDYIIDLGTNVKN